MKKIVIYGLTLIATCFTSFALAGSPNVVGSWKVTFYPEPLRPSGATQCITLVSAPGTVSGVPTSGTWTSPSFPSWHGQWIQLGDHVRWFGVTDALSTEESGNLIYNSVMDGVSFNHFFSLSGATSSAGQWIAVRTASCDTFVSESVGDDPAGIVKK